MSRDPIEEKGGLNLYGFVGNDGISRIDYLGKKHFYYNYESDDIPFEDLYFTNYGYTLTWSCEANIEYCCSSGESKSELIFEQEIKGWNVIGMRLMIEENSGPDDFVEEVDPLEFIRPSDYVGNPQIWSHHYELSSNLRKKARDAVADRFYARKAELLKKECAANRFKGVTCKGKWRSWGALPNGDIYANIYSGELPNIYSVHNGENENLF